MAEVNEDQFAAMNFWRSVEKKNISINFKESKPTPKAKLKFPILQPPPPPPSQDDFTMNPSLPKSEWDEQNVTGAFDFWKKKAVQLKEESDKYNARRNNRGTVDLTNILAKSTTPPLGTTTTTTTTTTSSTGFGSSTELLTPPLQQQQQSSPTITTTPPPGDSPANSLSSPNNANNQQSGVTSPPLAVEDGSNNNNEGGEIKRSGSASPIRDWRRSRSISCEIIPQINSVPAGAVAAAMGVITPRNNVTDPVEVDPAVVSSQRPLTSSSENQQQQPNDDVDSDSDSSLDETEDSELELVSTESEDEDEDFNEDENQPQVISDSDATPNTSTSSLSNLVQDPTQLTTTTTTITKTTPDSSTTITSTSVSTSVVSANNKPDQAETSLLNVQLKDSQLHGIQQHQEPATPPTHSPANAPSTPIRTSNSSSPQQTRFQTPAQQIQSQQKDRSGIPKSSKKDSSKQKSGIGATLTRTMTKTFKNKDGTVIQPGSTPPTGTPGSGTKKEKVKLSKQEKERLKQEKQERKKKEKDQKKQQKRSSKPITKTLSQTDVKKDTLQEISKKIFKMRLTKLVAINNGNLPEFLMSAITYLTNSEVVDVQSIFVDAENDPTVKSLRIKSDTEIIEFSTITDPKVVGGLLLLFFAELPQPLFNSKFYDDLIEIHEITNQNIKLNDLKALINSLSQLRRSLLQLLVTFITSKYIINKDTATRTTSLNTISAVFGPHLFRAVKRPMSPTHLVPRQSTLALIIENYEFLFEQEEEKDIKYKLLDGTLVISEASIDKLLEKATDYFYPYRDKYFTLTFFISHHYFITPNDLVDKLIALFKENHLDSKKKWKMQRRSQKAACITESVKLWVEYCYLELREDKKLSQKILKGFPHLEAQLSSHLTHRFALSDILKVPKHFHTRNRSASFSESFLSSGTVKDGLSAIEIAEQATLADYDLFTNIRNSDWVRLMQGSVDPSTAPALSSVLKKSTTWVHWAMGEILTCEDKQQRVGIICLLVDVALHCYELANFNTSISIYNALTNHHVKRLQQTWDLVPKETNNKLNTLGNSLGIWIKPEASNPFQAICASITSACVPHFPTLRTILSQIDQKIPTKTENGFINADKLRTVYGIVADLQRLQYHGNYNMKPTKLFFQLQDINTLTMEELADLSLKCEPPVSKAKKYNAPDQMPQIDWKDQITKTQAKPLAQTSIGIDLPRLASAFIFKTSDPSEPNGIKTDHINSGNKIRDISSVISTLAHNFSTKEPTEVVTQKFNEYIPMSTDPDSVIKRELLTFLDEVCGEDSQLVSILKCCNQAVIAPVVIELTLNIAKGISFMDSGCWRIVVSKLPRENSNSENNNSEKQICVRHSKKQRSLSSQSKDYFEFEWYIQLELDSTCKNILSFDLKISSLVFSSDIQPQLKEQISTAFKSYLVSPDCIQIVNLSSSEQPSTTTSNENTN
eukprot:gene9989-12243_t